MQIPYLILKQQHFHHPIMFNLPSTCFLGLILIHFLQASYAQQNPNCVPSACGNIQNISYPFRLRGDPQHCGDSNYELVCENNTTTTLYLYSQRYIVQAINYQNYTIRLADAAVNNDTCSFPQYSLYHHLIPPQEYPYGIRLYNETSYFFSSPIVLPATFLSCPHPVNNSFYVNASSCVGGNEALNSTSRRYEYMRASYMNVSELRDNCSIGAVVMLSMPYRDFSNISLSNIHDYMMYGFELSWFSAMCGNCRGGGTCQWIGDRAMCRNSNRIICTVYNIQFGCEAGGTVQLLTEIQWYVADLGLRILLAVNLGLRVIVDMPIMLGLLICKFRRRHLSMFDVVEGFLRSQNNFGPIRYSNSDIRKMTKGLKKKLGQGGFGSVYKGKLRSGRDVAVKLLTSKAGGSGQDFINEIGTIGRIHHVNVVKLIGYSSELSKRTLVYDFMPNGSLEKYILGTDRTDTLDWKKKYDIAVGVARGIEYLHRGCDIQILHFDIKPHNILLDENFTPKISDFGLAKFYSTDHNTVTLTAARGTIGYVAPELINRSIGNVSYKADVYSFGMLLMEMVGLKRDLVENPDESFMYFPYWIYHHLDKWNDVEIGKVHEFASAVAEDDVSDEDEKITRKMAIVALWCIRMSPEDRPSMSKVVEMLEGEVGSLQVPPQPTYKPQLVQGLDETWDSDMTDSIAMLSYDTSGYQNV